MGLGLFQGINKMMEEAQAQLYTDEKLLVWLLNSITANDDHFSKHEVVRDVAIMARNEHVDQFHFVCSNNVGGLNL